MLKCYLSVTIASTLSVSVWLNSHSSCPNCRFCLIETCPKIVKDNSISTTSIVNSQDVASDTISSPPVQEVMTVSGHEVVKIDPTLDRDEISGLVISLDNPPAFELAFEAELGPKQ
ncbi:hypothetical protein MTR67_047275 [Solanum verrucosum]|uniref:Uncharacterized protein n=1 Tax=Solanum verrucosum TaxID=315347 RepID=A0AAF0UW86_SOLVR|nr:hypothetical protein MTR67_047275 [Solanum verrucosum]